MRPAPGRIGRKMVTLAVGVTPDFAAGVLLKDGRCRICARRMDMARDGIDFYMGNSSVLHRELPCGNLCRDCYAKVTWKNHWVEGRWTQCVICGGDVNICYCFSPK